MLEDNGIEDLTQYDIESTKLKTELKKGKIPYAELLERKKKLFDLIPTCWIVDDFGLYRLIDEVYADDPEHIEYKKTMFFTVPIKAMTDQEIEEYVKTVVKKFKKK